MKPALNKRRNILFSGLCFFTAAGNLLCGFLNYILWNEPAVAPSLNETLVSSALIAGGIATFGFLFTLISYLLSLDPHRKTRPRIRLGILFFTFFVFVAGYFLGVMKILPDNVPVLGLSVLGCVVLSLAVLYLERLLGLGLARGAQALFGSGSIRAALWMARLGLCFAPGQPETERLYGLALEAGGAPDKAQPYLEDSYAAGERSPQLLGALGRLYETRQDPKLAAEMFDQLYHAHPSPQLLSHLVALWTATGQKQRALEELQKLPEEQRQAWTQTILELLTETGNTQGLRRLCQEFENQGPSLERARDCYDRLLELAPNDTQTLEALVSIAQRMRNDQQQGALLEKLVQLAPEQSRYHRQLFEHYQARGNQPAAIEQLKELIRLKDASLQEKLQMLDHAFLQAEYQEVERFVAEHEDVASTAQGLYVLAASLYEANRLGEALKRIQEAREHEPDHELQTRLTALESRIQSQTLASELEDLGQRSEANPHDTQLRFEYLDRLIAAGLSEKAVLAYEDMLAADPDLRDRVVEHLQQSMQRHGRNFRLLAYLSDIYVREKNWDMVFSTYEQMAGESLHPEATLREGAARILRENPEHLGALLSLAQLARSANDAAKVLDYLERYYQAGGEHNEQADRMEFEAASQIADHARALSAGSRLLEVTPENTDLLIALAEHHAELHQYEHALALLQKVRDLDPENRRLLVLTRQYDEAHRRARIEELKSYLEQNPGDNDRLEELGDLYYDFGEFNSAIVEYQRASLGTPANEIARAKLGYVLTVKEMFPDAEEVLNEVELSISQPAEQQAKLKALFYNAAQLMEKEDQYARALQLYKRIFRIDAGYRDTVTHIERLQRIEKKKR